MPPPSRDTAPASDKLIADERGQFSKFFEISTDIMVIADPQGCFKKVNPSCLQILGYSEEELLAKPFIDFVYPDDKQPTSDEMARQMQIGSSLDFENRYMRKDGSIVWLSWRASYDKNDGITYATARDITERKGIEKALQESEKRYRLLAETAGESIFVIDRDDRIQYVNTAAARPFQKEPGQIIGKKRTEMFPPETAGQQGESLRQVFATGKQFYVENLNDFGGRKIWLGNWLTPIRDDAGAITAVMGVSRDITERKEAENKEKKHLEELENMNRLMIGRELKMIELKKENERLAKRLAQR